MVRRISIIVALILGLGGVAVAGNHNENHDKKNKGDYCWPKAEKLRSEKIKVCQSPSPAPSATPESTPSATPTVLTRTRTVVVPGPERTVKVPVPVEVPGQTVYVPTTLPEVGGSAR